MKKTFLALLGAALLTWGCKKNNELPNPANSYQPVTKGSYWKYTFVSGGELNSSTQTVTGDVESILGKTYYKFQTSREGGVGTAYYAQKMGTTSCTKLYLMPEARRSFI